MIVLNVYRTALESLAKQGNAEAALALKIGENVGDFNFTEMTTEVCEHLSMANEELADALRHNGDDWSGKTDRSIENARTAILDAVATLAQR